MLQGGIMKEKLKYSHAVVIGYDPSVVRARITQLLRDNKPTFKSKSGRSRKASENWLNHGIGGFLI